MLFWPVEQRRRMRVFYIFFLAAILQAQNSDTLAEKSRLARQAVLEKRYGDAIALYRELVKAMPDNPGLRLNLAIALDKAGQPSAAIPEIERVTRAEPSSATAWLLLGLAYQQLHQPGKALAPLREAVRLDATNSEALLELADAELRTGAARDAAREVKSLSVLRPSMSKAWELGLAYQQLHQPGKALAPLREAVRLDATNSEALLELADAELRTGAARAKLR